MNLNILHALRDAFIGEILACLHGRRSWKRSLPALARLPPPPPLSYVDIRGKWDGDAEYKLPIKTTHGEEGRKKSKSHGCKFKCFSFFPIKVGIMLYVMVDICLDSSTHFFREKSRIFQRLQPILEKRAHTCTSM